MPQVQSPRPVPIWVVGVNHRTMMNKFRRCKALAVHKKSVKNIEMTRTDRVDNHDQIKDLKFSRKCHSQARNCAVKWKAEMNQRNNLIMFLNLKDARYGNDDNILANQERQRMLEQVNNFKRMQSARELVTKKRKIRSERRAQKKRIQAMKPSPYLDRKLLAKSFRRTKGAKTTLVTGKARLRADSFQIMEKLEKDKKKRMKKYHDMALTRKTARKKRNSKSRKVVKPELPFWKMRAKRKKRRERPKSAKVGLNQFNQNALQSRATTMSEAMALRPTFRPSRIQTGSQYIDYAETIDAHDDIKRCAPRVSMRVKRMRRPSQASLRSSPHFAIETTINRLLFTHIMEHDEEDDKDDTGSAITEYLMN